MEKLVNSHHYELAVVVINFRTADLTMACLHSLCAELKTLNACVVLVDNFSNDGSLEKIEQQLEGLALHEQLIVCRSSRNGGFSAGNNVGIQAVSADFYLLANSDTLISEGALGILLKAAKANPQAGLVAPRLEWPDGTAQESCFKFHNPLSELASAAKTGFISRFLKNYLVPQAVSDHARFYDWLSFACVLIKADVFAGIGLMDEGYFMYYEDVAFCYHAKQSGWQIYYEPAAHVVHLRGGSSPLKAQMKLRKRLPRYYFESRSRYFYNTYGQSGLLAANLCWTLGWLITSLRRVCSKTYLPDVAQHQWRDIWINFFHPLKSYLHPDHYDQA
ncbi:glycosyltransferase [Methylosoma difficile]